MSIDNAVKVALSRQQKMNDLLYLNDFWGKTHNFFFNFFFKDNENLAMQKLKTESSSVMTDEICVHN